LVIHLWIVIHSHKNRPKALQLAWRERVWALDAKGDLKDVDHLLKGFGVRIAFNEFPKFLKMVFYVGQGITLKNRVLTVVPNPFEVVETCFQVKPSPSQRPVWHAS
jgi:hypothetical protein